jgi:hypothetical protein
MDRVTITCVDRGAQAIDFVCLSVLFGISVGINMYAQTSEIFLMALEVVFF